jgi:polysaccharide pyruvyl transferase WcaK-like protein
VKERGPTVRRPARIVALGYQGWGNLGDEAILTGIERLLRDAPVVVEAVLSGPLPETISAFPAARRIPIPRLLPTPAALRSLWRADGLVLSGGGLIHDHWWSIIPRYLVWVLLARALGRRVVWLGVGAGPIRRRPLRWLARLAAWASTLVMVRDRQSAELLGGPCPHIRVVPDPGIFNDPPSTDHPREGLALIVRSPVPAPADGVAVLAERIIGLLDAADEAGLRSSIVSMAGKADAAIADALGAAGRTVEPLGPTPGAAIDRLAQFDGVVSVRLHGLLLAALAGTPCVAVAYDAKVRSVAEQLGIGDQVVGLAALDGPDVLSALADLGTPERRHEVADRVEALRRQRIEIAAAIVSALRGSS